MIAADTSFLISLYGSDVNSVAARAHTARSSSPIIVHAFIDFEFANALRLLVFRQKITAASCHAQLMAYAADKRNGKLLARALDANAVLTSAEAISAARTEQGGHRGYDVLQVAAAKHLGATEFWSFDVKQRKLAQAEGLRVAP